LKARWTVLPGVVEHTFTHFHLKLQVWTGRGTLKGAELPGASWLPPDEVPDAGLPNVMQKVVRHVAGASLREGLRISPSGKRKKPAKR
ncbi:MAG: NUDIX domain-containing protein, partial [Rubrivivax sp.]|nr:NUDIX domain-containing protein [Rubrivivax sp.]